MLVAPVRWRGSRTLIATLADDARKAASAGPARAGVYDASALEVLEALVEVSTARHA